MFILSKLTQIMVIMGEKVKNIEVILREA